jgi:serine/threonine protein kinase
MGQECCGKQHGADMTMDEVNNKTIAKQQMKISTMTEDLDSGSDHGRGSDRDSREMSGSTRGDSQDTFDNKYYSSHVNIDDFHIKAVIGRGSFGKVYCVVKKDDNKVYAMKTLKKEMIMQKDQLRNT